MGNLIDVFKKYNENSSPEDIMKGLQEGGYIYGLNPATEEPIFQNYLITLLNLKTNKELFASLNDSNDAIKEFSVSNSKSAKILNHWTMALAFATIALVFVTIIAIFY